MKTIAVAIPCRPFKVQVHLGPDDGLSLIEQFALRAIAAGMATEAALRQTLDLHPRVCLDMCVDLLRAGFISLGRPSGTLLLSDLVRREMGDPGQPNEGWARRLATSRPPEPREYFLLQELVSGEVFPAQRDAADAPFVLYAPENDRLPLIEEIPKAQLMVAVAGALRTRYTSSESDEAGLNSAERMIASSILRQRILDVTVHGAGATGDTAAGNALRKRAVVELRALPPAQEDDAPDLRVIGPATLPASVRRSIAMGLRQLWDRGIAREKSQFFGRLSLDEADRAQDERQGSLHPTARVLELERELSAMAAPETLNVEQLRQQHARLFSLERSAAEEVATGASYRADAQLISGAAAHHELLFRALREASQQVVLAGPWLGQLERNEQLRMSILDAVTRGVRVHLLWGVDHQAQAEQQLSAPLLELMALTAPDGTRPGALYVPRQSCAVHAKLIVCDMSWALVTSCNFLNSGPERSALELGVRLALSARRQGQEEGSGGEAELHDDRAETPRALHAILGWVRMLLPDFQLQRVLNEDPTLFGRRPAVTPVPIGSPIEPPSQEAPAVQGALGKSLAPGRFQTISLKLWHDAWGKRVTELKTELGRLKGAVIPTFDAEHRQLLLEAITSATQRLVLSSKMLGSGVLGAVPFQELLKAIQRGVSVTMVFSDEWDGGGEYGERRAKLEEAGARFLSRDVHAKVLVCDDWAIVSSFNFLSFEGYYDNERRARHELGVRILDPGFAGKFISQLESAPLK